MNKATFTGRSHVTTPPIFSINLVRELKGAPLTVLVAILLLEQSGQIPITAQLLKDVTGYGDHTITDSLRMLESPTRQYVKRIVNGWRLSQGFQLPLEIQSQNRDIRGSIDSSSSFLIESAEIYSEEEQEENREIRESRGFSESRTAAIKAGIRDPKASILARMPHVTPEFINKHVAWAKSQGNPIGTAIYRIENNWAISDDSAGKQTVADDVAALTGHEPGCKCTDCQYARAGGKLCPDCRHYICECEDQS